MPWPITPAPRTAIRLTSTIEPHTSIMRPLKGFSDESDES